ncbi:DNA-binding XRE family transcriptional regulator [Arthrobacter sp. GAS37]|uniref:hypothetical protein n=1 Tax=Arthrobacter sp. GAS37 TaxID=3156261 RepID=UPI003837A9A2
MSQTTGEKIRAAAERILQGKPERSGGRITVTDLAKEAGLSRATVNKIEYRHLIEHFRTQSVSNPEADTSVEVWRSRYSRLEAATNAHMRECSSATKKLEAQLQTLANTVQLQAVLIEHLRSGGTEPTPLRAPPN